ncbi:uncharacterized protein MYCFIDRAFT_195207 [Pseudocercospora fijiensis CIRAD86]|uniref:NTF2-like domain-containing protein n=1 Tax=Pseudocercospora fijiensis (strain CIRAD86) TaxID=383855 RepID=M2ZYL2_PSEFD|nr:uncharacterized protein MYCFIDRAFT_195207 [Pseudocercospora fijiensis CIRAD86]EME84039.1 hypothetical protein MYCFIDRAFT_195207 [Pseudocercospora fijiensis CIRAD86]
MLSYTSIFLISLAAIGSLAAPAKRDGNWHDQGLTASEAASVAAGYGQLIRQYSTDLANQLLTPNFTDYSEGVNTLINSCPQGPSAQPLPLLSATFSTRAQFEQGQGEQPPINFEQLNLWYNPNSVTIRWKTTNTVNLTDAKPVIGLITMEVVKAVDSTVYPYQISTVYSEFDSGAWLQNLQEAGICSGSNVEPVPNPGAPAPTATYSAPAKDAQPTPPVVTEIATAYTTAYATETCTETAAAAATWRARFMV